MVPLTASIIAQLSKFLLYWLVRRRRDFRYLVAPGGMPSAHSAFVAGLAFVIGEEQGLGSVAFALALALAIIVMYDAAGVRRAMSHQARILNQILDEIFAGHPVSEQRVRELIGHTPFEVLVGSALGIFLAWLWP